MDWSLENSRLSERANFCIKKISVEPSGSFPRIFPKPSDLLGFYRLVNNPKVTYSELMENLAGDSFKAAKDFGGLVLAIHDTTTVTPDAKAGKIQGFSRVCVYRRMWPHIPATKWPPSERSDANVGFV